MKRKILVLFLTIGLLFSVVFGGIVPANAETRDTVTYAQETVQGAAILHCFNWSYNSIKSALPDIAAAGYTAVQTSPVQQPKDYDASWTDTSGQWWKLYQPLGLSVAEGGTWLGTKAELASLCTEADSYGIKVIVDIVANHLANDTEGGTFEHLNSNVDEQLQHSEYFHSDPNYINDDSRYNITQRHMGMPDLNTGNEDIQSYVLGLLEECVDCGVDGFRFDAAKHIELPTDDGCASDFWSYIIEGIEDYTENELFLYGEILGGAGTDIGNYTQYIAVTDNYTGDHALESANGMNAGALADSTYYKGADPAKSVLWAESHDTYMSGATSGISDDAVVKTWAIVGARAYSTSLYLARPNASMGAASSDETWKSSAVSEINKFKNHFNGTTEYLSYNGSTTYIERGNRGVVISKLDGAGTVSLTVHRMEDGVYTDQITGGTFTVENGVISGSVGSSGVAVVYNAEQPALEYITASPLYLEPSSNWLNDGARFAMFVYNSATGATAWASMTDADGDGVYEAELPEGDWTSVIFCRMDPTLTENSWTAKWNQTEDLFPDENTNCFSVAPGTWDEGGGTWSWYGPEAPADTWSVYAINEAGWSNVNIHYWGSESTEWPGSAMTKFSGNAVYTFDVPEGTTGIVFNNGAGSQTGDITSGIADGAVFIIRSGGSVELAPSYYLIGGMNQWAENDDYLFTINPCEEGKVEYILRSVELTAGTELKVKDSNNTWYPDGMGNYSVEASGVYNVYFRPNHDGNTDWYEGWFYVEPVSSPALPGDVDLSGDITALDALLALRIALGSTSGNITPEGLLNADINGSGEVDAIDALIILRLALAS